MGPRSGSMLHAVWFGLAYNCVHSPAPSMGPRRITAQVPASSLTRSGSMPPSSSQASSLARFSFRRGPSGWPMQATPP